MSAALSTVSFYFQSVASGMWEQKRILFLVFVVWSKAI